ncbi:MAG TPA: DUF2505 family protein, partial [Polyangiales bacterium]|nr:DUF2505 family protein [Polyangiales bacterium]
QQYDVSVDTYWEELCFNLEYTRRLYAEALGCTEMTVLKNEGSRATGIQRHLRFIKPMDMPGPIAKIFGGHVTMDELADFDAREQRWSYRMVPSIMGDRIDIRGRVQVFASGSGSEQRSINTVTCKLFGLGGIVEPFVMREAAKGHNDRYQFTLRYIKEKQLT